MKLLTLGHDPAITYGFLAQLDHARPNMFTALTAHSPLAFETLATNHRDEIDLILLGAAQTDMEVEVAKQMVQKIWPADEMRVLRLPPALLTEEGKQGGMLEWFLSMVDGIATSNTVA